MCEQCGATLSPRDGDCHHRFQALLALDHSREEPWGSRHGLAFAAFALQHPRDHDAAVLERAWVILHTVFLEGRDPARVLHALRRTGGAPHGWDVPPLPAGPPHAPFAVTIADLGYFGAASYPRMLDAWCRAALEGWSGAKL
jgi:hypothetical protein